MDQKSGYPHQPPPAYNASVGGGPQPMGFAQPPPPGANQVFVSQPATVIVNQPLGPRPCPAVCPSCHARITTRMEYEPGTKTHLLAALICLFGGICCFCLPYCMDSCMNGNHYCPNCGAYIGTYSA